MSSKLAPQILFINGECSFSFLNFSIIGFCNTFTYSTNFLFSETTPELSLVSLFVLEAIL